MRPEHLQIAPLQTEEKRDDLSVPGEVSFATHLGTSIEYEVRLESGHLLSVEMKRMRDQSPVPKGSKVLVAPIDLSCYIIVPGR